MLQKSKSKKAAMMKYLVVIPATVLSLFIFSTTVIAQAKNEKTLEKKKEKPSNQLENETAKNEKLKILEAKNFKKTNNISPNIINNDTIAFAKLDEIPTFEGCENLKGAEAKNCFIEKMNQHIKQNFTYPKEAQDKNIQGRVTAIFIITKEGEVKIQRTKAPENCESLEKELIRILNLLPKFKPGILDGKPVNVSYAQPIMFKLQTESEVKKE